MFATIAAEGIYCQPLPVKSITGPGRQAGDDDVNGERVRVDAPRCHRVFSKDVARAATDAARCVTGYGAARGGCGGTPTAGQIYGEVGRPIAGKTGTTDNNRTAWFSAFTPQLAGSAFVADPDSAADPAGGGLHPLPMATARRDLRRRRSRACRWSTSRRRRGPCSAARTRTRSHPSKTTSRQEAAYVDGWPANASHPSSPRLRRRQSSYHGTPKALTRRGRRRARPTGWADLTRAGLNALPAKRMRSAPAALTHPDELSAGRPRPATTSPGRPDRCVRSPRCAAVPRSGSRPSRRPGAMPVLPGATRISIRPKSCRMISSMARPSIASAANP